MNRQGFTLIELLVVMAIMGIILATLYGLFSNTLSATSNIQSRSEGLNDLQTAQQLVSGKLREAWYIFPKATGTLNFTSQASVINPTTNTAAWNLSTSPMLAMILPPETLGTCTAMTPDTCYTFYAYYPIKRADAVGPLLTVDVLPADSANDGSVWTLMEYRRPYLVAGPPSKTLAAVPVNGTVFIGRVVADYLQPTNLASIYTMFTFLPTSGEVSAVTLSLRGQRKIGAQTLYLPSQTDVLTIAVAPRNLNK